MATVNFREIGITDITGNEVKLSVAEQLGNQLYMQGRNIEECELGKKIYFAQDAIELTEKEAATVKGIIGGWPYVTRKAIEKEMKCE